MQNNEQNNKRLAKNTIMLYLRMIVITIVSLYTARLVLQLLGVKDYGIYNVVGGIIGFMGVITGTMSSATQRFLSYDLGTGNIRKFSKTFSMLINIFVCFCVLGVLTLELIGPWFIANHLVIPGDRIVAAQWVFQFTIITFVLQTMLIPYQASIVSYERMGIYAYFSFIDVFFKLLSVVVLKYTTIDKLISYSFTYLLMSLVVNVVYIIYCRKYLSGCKYHYSWDKDLFRRMSSFAGWNLFGSLTSIMNSQGQAILLNIFFGPVVNAAKSIADKINQIVSSFVTNFFMALNPQIIKTYANGELSYTKELVVKSSKFSVFLLMLISFPLIFCMESILTLWLGKEQVSYEMVRFSQLILIYFTFETLQNPLSQVMRATGNIKQYQISVGVQTLSFIPICYIAFKLGFEAYVSLIILIIIYAFVHITRVVMVCPVLSLKIVDYLKLVILPIAISWLSSALLGYILVPYKIDSLYVLFFYVKLVFLSTTSIVFILGFTKSEKRYVIAAGKKMLSRYWPSF